MTIADYLVLSLFFGFWAVSTYRFRRVVWRHHIQEANKYPLYAARDQFIYLVASGKVKEDDFIFREFYQVCCDMIRRGHKYDVRHVIRWMLRNPDKDPSHNEFLEKIERHVKESSPEMQGAVYKFYSSMLVMFYYNLKIANPSGRLIKCAIQIIGLVNSRLRFLREVRDKLIAYQRLHNTPKRLGLT